MKKNSTRNKALESMRPEYRFDYTQSKPNRFAERLNKKTVAVVLEPDVAEVFQSSESVNKLLRSVISAVPARQVRSSKGRRRKAG